jgi:hypothetical protein
MTEPSITLTEPSVTAPTRDGTSAGVTVTVQFALALIAGGGAANVYYHQPRPLLPPMQN